MYGIIAVDTKHVCFSLAGEDQNNDKKWLSASFSGIGMAKIILISCVKSKLSTKAKARHLYTSDLFKKSLAYAEMQHPDKIFILSAKYGLLRLNRRIEPYEKTLNNMYMAERKTWAAGVLKQLERVTDLKRDEFIILAGEKYRQYLVPHLSNVKTPLKGKSFGNQLRFLKLALLDKHKFCRELHQLFNSMYKHHFPFDDKQIPQNGIYILFEKGERAHGTNRIVRIGTHTGKNQLRSRLKQHFIHENKDRSIFRKNIGRALLNNSKDKFLEQWEIDLTTRKAKNKHAHKIDHKKQMRIEKEVTQYIQKYFSFIAFQIDSKEERLKFESKIISTINQCPDCCPSKRWIGNSSPKVKIRESGLWQVNELNKNPLNDSDTKVLKNIIAGHVK